MPSTITLHSIGRSGIQCGEAHLTPRAPVVFSLGLYLILERGKQLSRRKLNRLFYGEDKRGSKKTKTNNLRHAMTKLRKFGFDIPDNNDDLFIISPDLIQTDFEHLLPYMGSSLSGDLRFLPDFDPELTDEFDEWLTSKRWEIEELIEKAVARQAALQKVEPPVQHDPNRMYGRETDMERLSEFVELIKSGKGKSYFLWGEAGIGKSRLAAEVGKYAKSRKVRTIVVGCQAGDSQMPLSLFVSLIPELLDKAPVAGRKPELEPYLKRIVEHDSSAPVEQTDAEVQRWRTRTAIFDLFDAACYEEEPVLVVIEDIHWTDEQSARLIQELMIRGSNKHFGFLLTSRYAYEESTKLMPPAPLLVRQLRGLTKPDCYELASAIAYGLKAQVGQEDIDKAVRDCAGNPYFLAELINHCVRTNKDSSTPPTIQGVLREKLSRVSPMALQMLQAAALLGKHSTLKRVSDVLDYKAHDLLVVIDELNAADMLVEKEGAYTVETHVVAKHDLLAVASVEKLSDLAKKMLHQRIAEVLGMEVSDQSATTVLWDCAEHWRNAGNLRKATKLALGCANQIMEMGFPKEASRALERAFYYCTTDYDKLTTLQSLAKAQDDCGEHIDAIETLAVVRLLRARLYPHESTHNEFESRLFNRIMGLVHYHSFRLPCLVNCLNDQKADNTHRIDAGIAALKSVMDCDTSEKMRAVYTSIEPLLKLPGIPVVKKLEAAFTFHNFCGDIRVARKILPVLAKKARQQKDPVYAARLLSNCSLAACQYGDHDLALSLNCEVLPTIVEINKGLAAGFYYTLSRMYIELDRPLEAEEQLDKAIEMWSGAHNAENSKKQLLFNSYVACGALRIAIHQGDMEKVKRIAKDIKRLDPKKYPDGSSGQMWRASLILAEIYTDKSLDVINSHVPILEFWHKQLRWTIIQDFFAYALAKGLQFIGDIKKADDILLEYADIYRRELWPAKGPLAVEIAQARSRQSTSQPPQ